MQSHLNLFRVTLRDYHTIFSVTSVLGCATNTYVCTERLGLPAKVSTNNT